MKASELRIGNIVFSKNAGGLIVVQFIPIDIDMNKYGAVQLSEEILLKFGFEKGVHGDWYKAKMKGWFTKFTSEQGLYSYQFGQYHIASVKFVHQLQNLYFALCGEELELK